MQLAFMLILQIVSSWRQLECSKSSLIFEQFYKLSVFDLKIIVIAIYEIGS